MTLQQIPNAGSEKLEAPYAPPSHVIGILHRFKEKALPTQLTVAALGDLKMGTAYAYRVLGALQFLGFLDEGHHPEPIFHSLRTLPEDGYKALLAERLRESYPSLFEHLDPTTDEDSIRDHFRRYDPASQTERQFLFFRALCVEAGLIERKAASAPKPSRPGQPQGRLKGTGPTNQTRQPHSPPPEPKTDDAVRRLLTETLVEKIKEVDAEDWDTIQKYLDKIEELSKSGEREA